MGTGIAPPMGQFILTKGVWSKVIDWFGFVVLPVEYTVTSQTEFRGFPIRWRRYGVGPVPYWEGDFKEQESFHIYPGDLWLRVDFKPIDFDLGISIERTSADK